MFTWIQFFNKYMSQPIQIALPFVQRAVLSDMLTARQGLQLTGLLNNLNKVSRKPYNCVYYLLRQKNKWNILVITEGFWAVHKWHNMLMGGGDVYNVFPFDARVEGWFWKCLTFFPRGILSRYFGHHLMVGRKKFFPDFGWTNSITENWRQIIENTSSISIIN